jgi:hypothetical protein
VKSKEAETRWSTNVAESYEEGCGRKKAALSTTTMMMMIIIIID